MRGAWRGGGAALRVDESGRGGARDLMVFPVGSRLRPAPVQFQGVTTCFTGLDVLPPNSESPPYTALTEMIATFSLEVVKLAVPPCNDPHPISLGSFAPRKKETISPSWGGPLLEVTTAVNVTGSPTFEGFGLDVNVVAVDTRPTPVSETACAGAPLATVTAALRWPVAVG